MTKFVVVHQPFHVKPQPMKVERHDSSIMISGEGYRDTVHIDKLSFTREFTDV